MNSDTGEREGGRGKVTSIGGHGLDSGDSGIDRFARSFEASARRWELVVYPSLFAFIILASYGFYLVYSLTHDVGILSRNVVVLTQSMSRVTDNISDISHNMHKMTDNVAQVSSKMDALAPMQQTMDSMGRSLQSVDYSTRFMAQNTDRMSYYVGSMNHNMRPLGDMSNFMPW